MNGASRKILVAGVLALLLAGCSGEPNPNRPEPGVHFHGKVQMGVAKDADGNVRTVTRITG
ncbi:hypothetical protein [Vannielia litorea]|uniref:hypothetical protein n=1 Tax=Vannielia litorea TaxID=1217970 RepID=UPI001BCE103D|nr:hypothetical protein [Vannielia litorea]MBS8227841.1 hypothetical protein [Vannielia litorea]